MGTFRPNGARILALRKSLRLSQESVAAKSQELPPPRISFTARTYGTAERSAGRVGEEVLRSIAAVLDTTFEDIVMADDIEDPFRGFEAYTMDDEALFGGRDKFIERGVEMLGTEGVALISGASGAGKSSLCQAGIIPRVVNKLGPCTLIPFRPGVYAVDSLASALSVALDRAPTALQAAEAQKKMREALKAANAEPLGVRGADAKEEFEAGALANVLAAARAIGKANRFLIYLDQGEELVTRSRDAALALRLLDTALKHEGSKLLLMMSVRADHLGDLTNLDGSFFSRFDRATMILRRMDDGELREAIEAPLRERRVKYGAALIDQLILDARDQPGYLPHIQFVLSTLWAADLPKDERLTLDRYHDLGGLGGAIARHASRVFDGLSKREQARCEQAIPLLVTQSVPGHEVSARRPMESFTAETQDLLHSLAGPQSRIIAIDDDSSVGFAHEEIIRQWPELQVWLARAKPDVGLREALERDVAAWLRHDKSWGFLVPRGEKQRAYKALLARLPEDALTADVRDFVSRSELAFAVFNPFTIRITAAAVIITLSFIVYQFASERIDDWRRTAAFDKIQSMAAAKKPEIFLDEKIFFPDSPSSRMASHKEIAAAYRGLYNIRLEGEAVNAFLNSCASFDGLSVRGLNMAAMNFEGASDRCGYGKISDLEVKSSLLTSTAVPAKFSIIRSRFVGSYVNRVNFRDADLNGTYFPCTVIDRSNFARVKNFNPDQIEDSFCLFLRDGAGPPKLPEGWKLPAGCQWMADLKDKYGWKSYARAEYPSTREEQLDIWRRQAATVKRHYYSCLKREGAFERIHLALKLTRDGKIQLAKQIASEILRRHDHPLIRVKSAPIFLIAGEESKAAKYYQSVRGVYKQRWGDFSSIALADLRELREAGHRSKQLNEFYGMLTQELVNN